MGKYESKVILPPEEIDEKDAVVIDYAKIEKREKFRILLLRLGVAVVLVALWEILARVGVVNTYYWSSPSRIWKCAVTYFTEKALIIDIYTTGFEALLGFIAGTVVGAVIGMSFWWSKT